MTISNRMKANPTLAPNEQKFQTLTDENSFFVFIDRLGSNAKPDMQVIIQEECVN